MRFAADQWIVLHATTRRKIMSDYQITAKEIEPQRVAILHATIAGEAGIGRLFRTLHETLREYGVEPAGPQVAIYLDKVYTPRNIDVVAAVPIAADVHLPDTAAPVKVDELPGGLVASLLRIGPWDNFQDAYEAILEWVEANGYAVNGPNREVHLLGPRSGVPPEEYELEIQFPIVKR